MKRTAAQVAEGFTARREKRQVEPAVPRAAPKRPGAAKLPGVARIPQPQEFKHERMPITRQQIISMQDGAVAIRDQVFVRVCERALRGEVEAVNACKGALYGLA